MSTHSNTMSTHSTIPSYDPWAKAIATGDSRELSRHIFVTVNLQDGVHSSGCTADVGGNDPSHIKVFLHKGDKSLVYKIDVQPAETGERVLKAKTVLAQVILDDPLLLKGVSDFDCSDDVSYIIFHGHRVDISPFFDGKTIETGAIINEIIRKVTASSGAAHICNIGLVPITKSVAFLECETAEQRRFYEEEKIRKWVSKKGTAPFTREACTLSDIQTQVSIAELPRLSTTRKAESIDKPPSKRVCSIRNKHVSCLWDRSGSMQNMEESSLKGLKDTIEEQRNIAASSGNPTRFTLTTFDSVIERVVDTDDICTVNINNLADWIVPRGMTRLHDAIIDETLRLVKVVKKDESGVLIVMTDGADTCSESNADIVRQTLQQLQSEKAIECIFMAANIGNAQVVGSSLGFSEETSITFSPESSGGAFRCASQSAVRSMRGGSAAFTQAERQTSCGPPIGHSLI